MVWLCYNLPFYTVFIPAIAEKGVLDMTRSGLPGSSHPICADALGTPKFILKSRG